MANSCDLTGFAGQILEGIGDTTTTTGSVITWLRVNVGMLNLHIHTDYILSGDCITPGLGQVESGIYAEMYYCNRLRKLASSTILAAECDWTAIEFEEQGAMRKESKINITKMYQQMWNDCNSRLKDLFKWYNRTYSPVLPEQVLTDYRYGDKHQYEITICPPDNSHSSWNPFF